MIKDYGFRAPVYDKGQHVFGSILSLPKVVIQPSGQYDAFMPTYEPQYGGGWDTDGCTIWGTENAIEFLVKKVFGIDANYSERFTYIGTHTRPPGNDPHVIAEWIRGNGVIDQAQLPMTDTFEEFILPDPMPGVLITQGKIWAQKNYQFGHEWVFQGDIPKDAKVAAMKECLTYSPLGVSVSAWHAGPDGVYVDQGYSNCHWCVCFGWDDAKRAWKIFDSYDQSVKYYSFDSDISFCKRYMLTVRPSEVATTSFFSLLIAAIKSIFCKNK